MNRDEAVKKIAKEGKLSIANAEDLYDSIIPKPVVPQYVADWYEEHKDEFYLNVHLVVRDFFEHLNANYFNENPIDYDFACWYYNTKNALQILVNMHQLGYEVEEETEYEVKLKKTPQILHYDEKNEQYYFSIYSTIFSREYHTRKDLEDGGFDWVFDCEGVEVIEVK